MNMRAEFFGGVIGLCIAMLGAVQASAQCPTSMAVTQVASGCGADVSYAVTNTVGFQFIQFALDGTPISTQQSGTVYLDPGTYVFSVSTNDANNCTMYIEEEVTVQASAGGMQVNLPDNDGLVACNGTLFISATITGSSTDFSYLWEPTAVVNSPTAQTVGITVTAPQWVYVAVTDNVSGCMAVDSVFVSPNLPVNQTLTLCNGLALLQLDPGSMMYNWTATDPDGNTIDMSSASGNSSFEATAPGNYVVVTYYSGCNVTTHLFSVEECITPLDHVWPGDANSDGEATNTDALWVGIAFDETGPIRPSATLLWEGQPAPDWNFNFSQNNANLKHADTDGNGTVNFADTIAISQNYGQTHGKTESALGGAYPMLWVEATPDTVGLSQAVNITVHLANAAMPIDSLHGIAFTLTFNEALVTEDGFSIDFSQNVLGTAGTDVLTLQQPFFANGEIDVAISRTTLQNFSGHGPLMAARIVTTDNLSGIQALRIGLSGVTAITASEAMVMLTTLADTVVIDPTRVGMDELFGNDVSIYPNPSHGIFHVDGPAYGLSLEVMDATGRVISTFDKGNATRTIDLSSHPAGIYLVRMWNASALAVKRIELLGH